MYLILGLLTPLLQSTKCFWVVDKGRHFEEVILGFAKH